MAATLPDVSPIEHNIRQLIRAGTPILALSDSDDYDGLLEAGFDEVVKKPVDRRELEQVLVRRASSFSSAVASTERGPEARASTRASAVAGSSESQPLRVLVVEDHWANRRLLEAMLIKQGHIMEVLFDFTHKTKPVCSAKRVYRHRARAVGVRATNSTRARQHQTCYERLK